MRSAESRPPADNRPVDVDMSWKPQNAQPRVDPQRRQTLERMHQQLAYEWSEQLREYLPKGDQFRFLGFEFQSFAQCPELNSENACSIVFRIDSSPLIGVIGFNEKLARCLVNSQLGAPDSIQQFERAAKRSDEKVERPTLFTRLENALLNKSLLSLLDKLGTIYAEAGIGIPKPSDQPTDVKAALGLLPDEPLIVFRFKIGEADSLLNLFIASVPGLVDAVHGAPRQSLPEDDGMRLSVTTAQLDIKLVLGSWTVTVEELSHLRNGDEIVLPDGTDAWLTAGPIPIKRVTAKLLDGRIIVAPKGGPGVTQ
jgi:flagellar motor switch protein FliM